MEQAGVEESPGPLPAVKVVRHVAPMKSPPAAKVPTDMGEILDFYIPDLLTHIFTILAYITQVHNHHS